MIGATVSFRPLLNAQMQDLLELNVSCDAATGVRICFTCMGVMRTPELTDHNGLSWNSLTRAPCERREEDGAERANYQKVSSSSILWWLQCKMAKSTPLPESKYVFDHVLCIVVLLQILLLSEVSIIWSFMSTYFLRAVR